MADVDYGTKALTAIPYNDKEVVDYLGSEKKSFDEVEDVDSNNEEIGTLLKASIGSGDRSIPRSLR